MHKKKRVRSELRFQPAQVLAVSFLVAIFVGTVLLMLPFSSQAGHMSLPDALFTSASAVCVTGLIVQDTATFFTPAGKVIILFLFQLGGLGIMTFSTLVLLVAGKRVSIQDRIIIQEGYQHSASSNVKTLIRDIFLYTLVFESLGTFLFLLRWNREFSFGHAFLHSLFHAVSAFCNAGFSLFQNSFISYRGDILVNVTLMILIVSGGLGFLVLQEMKLAFKSVIRKKKISISLHSKLVLSLTLILIFFSGLVILVLEWNHSLQDFTGQEKVLSAFFQVITARTAGFNTLDLNSLSSAAVLLIILLMFIGASPGSTGGGIKTSTVGVVTAFLRSRIQARESLNLFHRSIPAQSITKAFTLVTLSVGIIFASAFILFLLQPGAEMKNVFFEVFSAFGTVGLSLGLTPELNDTSKVALTLTMYAGRIGPLTLLYAFSRAKALGRFEYAEETVMIG